MSKKKINVLNTQWFSLQLKKALFYAFLEARKQNSNIIDSKFLLFGLLKVNNSLANRSLKKISNSSSGIDRLLTRLKLNFQIKTKSSSFSTDRDNPNFSKPVKRLLFFLIRSSRGQKHSVITTSHVLTYLLRHKSLAIFVKDSLANNK